jgi:hypothetical protein
MRSIPSHNLLRVNVQTRSSVATLIKSKRNVENSILPNDYILLRNKGEDQEGDGEGLRDGGDQQRRPNQVRGPSESPTWSPGAGSTKTDAQVACGLRLGHSSYARKAKKTIYPMVLVPYQNSI